MLLLDRESGILGPAMKSKIITLKNESGCELRASTLGGIVTSLKMPGANGEKHEVLLAGPRPESHHEHGYMNAIIGRVGNRISGGGFMLDGVWHPLETNSVNSKIRCTLHGGNVGFDQKIWDAETFVSPDGPAVAFSTLSPHMDQGFPGNLFVRVVYTLCNSCAWRIDYLATTDAPTVVNLTQHAYFNLSGGKRDIRDSLVQVSASRFTEAGPGLIPTGKILPVANTAMDLTECVRLGDVLDQAKKDPHLKTAGGLDHNFVLDRHGPGLFEAAALLDLEEGLAMRVFTTEPGVQVYSGNFLEGTPARGGAVYHRNHGICFETQHAPDSPNQAGFESIRLDPGQTYRSTTVYAFETLEEQCDCDCGDDDCCDCGCHHDKRDK